MATARTTSDTFSCRKWKTQGNNRFLSAMIDTVWMIKTLCLLAAPREYCKSGRELCHHDDGRSSLIFAHVNSHYDLPPTHVITQYWRRRVPFAVASLVSSPVAVHSYTSAALLNITNEFFKTKSPSFLLTSAVDEWRNTNSALGATIVSSSWQRLETRLGSIHEEQPHCIWNMSLSSTSSTGMVGAHHGPAWKCCCRVRVVWSNTDTWLLI